MVNSRSNSSTLTTAQIRLNARCAVPMDTASSPSRYTMMMLASVKPRWENKKPISVQRPRVAREIPASRIARFRLLSGAFLATYTLVP